jgi:hypothetical protein
MTVGGDRDGKGKGGAGEGSREGIGGGGREVSYLESFNEEGEGKGLP